MCKWIDGLRENYIINLCDYLIKLYEFYFKKNSLVNEILNINGNQHLKIISQCYLKYD